MKSTRMLSVIAGAIILLLTAAIISMVFIKTNFNQVSVNDIEYIVVYSGKAGQQLEPNDNEYKKEYEDVMKLFNAGTKESVLSALLSGAYSSDAKAEINKQSIPNGFRPESGKVYLEIHYKTPQVIKLNGKDYHHEGAVNTINYYKVFVEIKNETTLTTTTAYYGDNESDTTASNYRTTFVAKHHKLYDYIAKMAENGILK